MKHRLNVNDSVIVAAVQNSFGITLQSLEFLPVGEGAWAYKGVDANNKEWFVKLCRLDTSNVAQVTSYLHNDLELPFVLSPILPQGQKATPKINDTYVSIYPYIEGETLSYDNLNKEYLVEIASDLRKLHDATLSQYIESLLPKETFDKYQATVPVLIDKASHYEGNDELLQQLRAVINAYSEAIEQSIRNARTISDYCKGQTYDMVVCHTDIHPFNVMKTSNGLKMIDWDAIMLAPREDDLRFYGAENRGDTAFHRAYGMDYQVDQNLITYYGYEWVLQEYDDWTRRLFDASLAYDARVHALHEFKRLFGSGKELGGVVKDALDSPLPS